MENGINPSSTENDGGHGRNDASGTSSSFPSTGHRLFDRRASIYQIVGGGKAADVLLWKRRHVSFGVIVVATVAWVVFERSGLPSLSLCSDILLILIVVLFLRANYAVFRNKQLETLPELELSEEMVNDAAASFRVKINYVLLMAHDITIGKDFRLFFKVVACLWVLSAIGGFFSFFTLAYIGTIISMTIPAVYSKFKDRIDGCCGSIHRKFSNHYRIVDENVISRLPGKSYKAKEN